MLKSVKKKFSSMREATIHKTHPGRQKGGKKWETPINYKHLLLCRYNKAGK